MTVSVCGFLTDFQVITASYRSATAGVRHMVTGITATFGISVCRVTFITNRSLQLSILQIMAIRHRHPRETPGELLPKIRLLREFSHQLTEEAQLKRQTMLLL